MCPKFWEHSTEYKSEKDNIFTPSYIIFEKQTNKVIHIESVFLNFFTEFSYHVYGKNFFSVGKFHDIIKQTSYYVIHKYDIMKDSVSFKNSIVLGDYTENIDRIFRHDTLDILTKDSAFVIDLTKFEIILKQKREKEDDEN